MQVASWKSVYLPLEFFKHIEMAADIFAVLKILSNKEAKMKENLQEIEWRKIVCCDRKKLKIMKIQICIKKSLDLQGWHIR